MTDSKWVSLAAPEWLSGRKPKEFLEGAGLRVRSDARGGYRVCTEEAYLRSSADLFSVERLFEQGRLDRLDRLASLKERATADLDYSRIQHELDELAQRATASGDFSRFLGYTHGILMATPVEDLPSNARGVLRGLVEVGWKDRGSDTPGPFPSPGLALMHVSEVIHTRLRIPSVLLRIGSDPQLAEGDLSPLREAIAAQEMLFPSSHGLYDGIYLMDPYIGPLCGAASPSVWSLAAPRTFGTLILPLGRAISGTCRDTTEPLQTIVDKSPRASRTVPEHAVHQQLAAVEWWGFALNRLFAVLTDLAVFSESGAYLPARHLNAMLTLEQLFRRVTSLLKQYKDVTAKQVLMFTCLDTLEGLTGRSLLNQFRASQAQKCLTRIRSAIPQDAQAVLLPGAERAEVALQQVQDGFTMLRRQENATLTISGKTLNRERAAANYLVALRNATHGHGGHKGTAEQRTRDTALLIQHDGDLADDLPLLAYLYLLDLLCDPDRLRRILGPRRKQVD